MQSTSSFQGSECKNRFSSRRYNDRTNYYLVRTNFTRRFGPSRYMYNVPVSMGTFRTLSLFWDTLEARGCLGGSTISSIPLNNPTVFPELRVAARVVWILSLDKSCFLLLLLVVAVVFRDTTLLFFDFKDVLFRFKGELLSSLVVSLSLSAVVVVVVVVEGVPSSVMLRNMRSGKLSSSLSLVRTIQCVSSSSSSSSGMVVTGDVLVWSVLSSVLARRMPIEMDLPWTIYNRESIQNTLSTWERIQKKQFEDSRNCAYLYFVADLIELRRVIRLGTACWYHIISSTRTIVPKEMQSRIPDSSMLEIVERILQETCERDWNAIE